MNSTLPDFSVVPRASGRASAPLELWWPPFDFAGNPTITLPNGIDAAGMPQSMQVVGPQLGEAMLVRVGHAFQTVTDWHQRRPV